MYAAHASHAFHSSIEQSLGMKPSSAFNKPTYCAARQVGLCNSETETCGAFVKRLWDVTCSELDFLSRILDREAFSRYPRALPNAGGPCSSSRCSPTFCKMGLTAPAWRDFKVLELSEPRAVANRSHQPA